MTEPDLGDWLQQLFENAQDRTTAIQTAWQHLEHAKLISKVAVHRYICDKCGPLVTVIRLGDSIIANARDYKQSPGMNRAKSVPSARARNTLDGDRHWPSHAYDVAELADFGPQAGIHVACRHVTTTLSAGDMLSLTAGVKPGHPGAPTRL